MDNSQSSDVFSHFSNVINNSFMMMDVDDYGALFANTKASLSDRQYFEMPSFSNKFSELLEDCKTCILQCLHCISTVLSETTLSFLKLCDYMENAACILQMLSEHIKCIIETVSMCCSNNKTLPITTGLIIMEVFSHCKNSEVLYDTHLSRVEKQLKSMFQTCHELQMTYLVCLEKHFDFDLTDQEQLDILVEALNINLGIGEVVQSLDVKTMAEQWKAYTAISEKHSRYLLETNVFEDCCRLLSSMITRSLRLGVQTKTDEKVVLRSLKVTNFTIKILLKMYTIFKQSSIKPHLQILELLIEMYFYNPSYLEVRSGKSQQFQQIMSLNIYNPTELLLKELICDETFLDEIIHYDVKIIQEDHKLLGYIYLLVSIMKCSLYSDREFNSKVKLLKYLFKLLPECYVLLILDTKFKFDIKQAPSKTIDLFEYLLIHATAVALTLNLEDVPIVEKCLMEAILGSETLAAIFASNLWTMLARNNGYAELTFEQLSSLCEIYQQLENLKLFRHSPQRVQLSYTISSLFNSMENKNKVRLLKQFDPFMKKNYSLWGVLKIRKLPLEFLKSVEDKIVQNLKDVLQKADSETSVYDLINLIHLSATCSPRAFEDLTDSLMRGWLRACPKNLHLQLESLDLSNLWYFEYVEALTALSVAMKCVIYRSSSNVVKILHVISSIIHIGNVELNMVLIDLLCKLSVSPIHDDNNMIASHIVTKAFETLVRDNNYLVRNKLFRAVKSSSSKYLEQSLFSIVKGNKSLSEAWEKIIKPGKENDTCMKEQLMLVSSFEFKHICMEKQQTIVQTVDILHSSSSNFDLADIDRLFDTEPNCEPASKKQKFDICDTEIILSRLENDVLLLCNNKENLVNVDYKNRIRAICEKLNNVT